MRQFIHEVLGAESGATVTEYGMFADICVDSAAFAAAFFGARWKGRIGLVAGQSENSPNVTKD